MFADRGQGVSGSMTKSGKESDLQGPDERLWLVADVNNCVPQQECLFAHSYLHFMIVLPFPI